MKVFKFGGVSIKDAESIKNVINILKQNIDDRIFLVVSAMGKTTNSFEKVINDYFSGNNRPIKELLTPIYTQHQKIANELEINFVSIDAIFENIETVLYQQYARSNYDEFYDQIVSFGESISLEIIYQYLITCGFNCNKIDAKNWVKTDNYFRFASVDLNESEQLIRQFVSNQPNSQIYITQGFVGATKDGQTTTLGREGSDYTAALAGAFLKADSVTVWKDVPGILNADPKHFPEAVKMPQLSYSEAIELAYYGAKVIHPKTIKPIENANIPLFVRSFIQPNETGTLINNNKEYAKTPSIIIHDNQLLITITVKDMSFITEELIYHIFGIIAECRIKVNMMQNSALSISLCVDADSTRTDKLIDRLLEYYYVKFNTNLQLISIRFYNTHIINNLLKNKEILLEQRSRIMAQFVTRNYSK